MKSSWLTHTNGVQIYLRLPFGICVDISISMWRASDISLDEIQGLFAEKKGDDDATIHAEK